MMNTDMSNSTSWNVRRRRDFSELDLGTHVPGYGGYIEQFKYHVGDTYGNTTKKLSKMRVGRHPIVSSLPASFSEGGPKIGTGLTGSVDMSGQRRMLTLPKSTGDNKLTEKMVPGYTGYIPRRPFKFGNTYKEDCDVCIDDFLTNTQNRSAEVADLLNTVGRSACMRRATDEKIVIDRLEEYRDRNPLRSVLMENKKHSREAPMPGYRGFIPRQGVTELGLGTRYHVVCDRSLNAFCDESDRQDAALNNDFQPQYSLSDRDAKASIQMPTNSKEAAEQRRLYKRIGMVPKYTGYLPQIRFKFGHTYGDTSRSLPVCYHNKETFGDFVETGISQSVM